MKLVCREKQLQLKISLFLFNIGVNLTTDSDTGQLDAYVKNAEWDLEGMKV